MLTIEIKIMSDHVKPLAKRIVHILVMGLQPIHYLILTKQSYKNFSRTQKLKNNIGKQGLVIFDFDNGTSQQNVLEKEERGKCHKSDEIAGTIF